MKILLSTLKYHNLFNRNNKSRFLLIILILYAGFCPLQAQDIRTSRKTSYYTYVYRLTDNEARKIYKFNLTKIKQSYFHTMVDSFPTDSVYRKKLENGHYLYLHAEGNQMKFKLASQSNVDVKIMNNSSDFVLYITDNKRVTAPNALVTIDNKKLKYDFSTGTYRLKHANVKGFLTVSHEGLSSFYYITRKKNNSALARTSRKVFYQTPLKYIAVPVVLTAYLPLDVYRLAVHQRRSGWIYFISQPFYDIVHSISWQQPEGFIEKIANRFNTPSRTYGYMAFNKTIFRPGDTVKWKAYVADRKKRPVKNELTLQLHDFNFTKNIALGKVKNTRPGVFHGSFVLADTMELKIDANYILFLSSRRYSLSGNFRLEDYELKNTKYELLALRNLHYAGEHNLLTLKGTDENDLVLADARAKIIIVPEEVEKTFQSRVFIPDTLWKHDLALNPSGNTEIEISADIFPEANFSYRVIADFLNSSNEHVTKDLKLRYCFNEDILKISFINDSVRFGRTINGVPVAGKGSISFFKLNDVISQIETDLPYTCGISPFVTRYEVTSGKNTAFKEVMNEPSLVECFSERDNDSVRFAVSNPRNLPLTCFVYNLNREVFRGSGDLRSFALPNQSEKNYYLSVHYIWNNTVVSENYEVPLKTSVLSITSDQPEYIYPGQKVTIKLKVTDYTSKPVEGADVLAYAMTAKMPRAGLPVLPDFETRKKQKELINEFFLKQDKINYSNNSIQMDWKKWNPLMHMDSITYFQFLYPEKGMFTCAFPMENPIIGYISPYVVQNGRIQPVYCIYVNNRIIYSHFSNINIPYVFAVPAGKINLRIRIPGAELIADNLYIEAGRKYVMSFDKDTVNQLVKIIKKPKYLTNYELNWVKYNLMAIDNNSMHNYAYLMQGNRLFPINKGENNYRSYTMVGPLNQSDYRYVVPGNFSIQESFEPGYRYNFKNGVVKMKSITPKEMQCYYFNAVPPEHFADSVITETNWLRAWQYDLAQKQAKSRIYNNPVKTDPGFGRMKLYYPPLPGRFTKNIILFNYDNSEFVRVYGNTELFHQLAPGLYRAVILDNNNAYLESDSLAILANGLNTFTIPANWKDPDSVSLRINQIIQKVSSTITNTSYENKTRWQSVNTTYLQKNNITLKGQNVIEGIIKDPTTGEPLPGVNIVAEGTNIGTTSDINGYYQIDVPPGTGSLTFSFIGYVSERVPIGLSRIINTTLTPDIQRLEEVVVVGYGTMKKSELTASVSTIQVRGLSGRAAGINTSAIYGSRAPELIESKGALSDKALNDTEFMNSLNNASSLRSNFNDNAFWQPALITDKNGEATFEVTFPDDITAWKTFYVAMGRKKGGSLQSVVNAFKPVAASLAVPRFLIEGDSSVLIGKVTNYSNDTLKAVSQFVIAEKAQKESNFQLVNSHIDSMTVKAMTKDSMTITYKVIPEKGIKDGEKRTIPILKRGSLETEGIFKTLTRDSTYEFIIPAHYTEAKLFLDADPLNIIRDEIRHVHNYGYLCNEQAASKLKSLLAEKTICKYLNTRFDLNGSVKKLINRLELSRNFENLWGWWKDSEESLWISLHVLEALFQAEKEGYAVKIPRETIQQYLLSRYPAYSPEDRIRALKILLQINSENKIKFDLESILKKNTLSFAARLEAIELLQKTGNKIDLDTLLKQRKETMFGNYYWNSDSFDISKSYIQSTLSMYRIIRNDSTNLDYLPKIRNFFIEERKSGNWRNTYESARIIETILPDMLGDKKKLTDPSAFIHINGSSLRVDSFPFRTTLKGSDTVKLSINGDFPVYATLFRKWWNTQPSAISKGFRVKTYFEDHINTLKAGNPVKLFAEIHVLKRASYVMVEIPIPAGCGYEVKGRQNIWEVHREYFKNKVCIFYKDLSIGNYKAEIELLPRFNGKYTINPAKAELMYFPVFFGRNEIQNVIVN